MLLYPHFARTALLLLLVALLVGAAGCQNKTDSDQKVQPQADAKLVTVAVTGMS